jgi:hypothetical protein
VVHDVRRHLAPASEGRDSYFCRAFLWRWRQIGGRQARAGGEPWRRFAPPTGRRAALWRGLVFSWGRHLWCSVEVAHACSSTDSRTTPNLSVSESVLRAASWSLVPTCPLPPVRTRSPMPRAQDVLLQLNVVPRGRVARGRAHSVAHLRGHHSRSSQGLLKAEPALCAQIARRLHV